MERPKRAAAVAAAASATFRAELLSDLPISELESSAAENSKPKRKAKAEPAGPSEKKAKVEAAAAAAGPSEKKVKKEKAATSSSSSKSSKTTKAVDLTADDDDGDVEVTRETTWEERDTELRKHAIELD